jgi:hypothetical protein
MGCRILTIILLLPLAAFAQSVQPDPVTLHARDAHQDLLIAADPYVSADRYKGQFGKKSPYEAGIVAIELIISQPDEARQRLSPLSPEDIADRTLLSAPHANPKVKPRLPFPVGGSNSSKGKDWNEMVTAIRSVALGTDVLPPHATTHGFLFFDLNHQFDAIRHTHVYIPDLAFMGNNKALFYFEINLGVAPTK